MLRITTCRLREPKGVSPTQSKKMMILENIFIFFNNVSSNKLFFYISWAYDYVSSLFSLSFSWVYDMLSVLTYTFGTEAIVMSIKFMMSVSLLIFIRGAIPRYRFDHLTRIG